MVWGDVCVCVCDVCVMCVCVRVCAIFCFVCFGIICNSSCVLVLQCTRRQNSSYKCTRTMKSLILILLPSKRPLRAWEKLRSRWPSCGCVAGRCAPCWLQTVHPTTEEFKSAEHYLTISTLKHTPSFKLQLKYVLS